MLKRLAEHPWFWGALILVAIAFSADAFAPVSVTSTISDTGRLDSGTGQFVPYTAVASFATLFLAVGGWILVRGELVRQKAREEGLREREARLRDAMNGSADGVFLLRAIRAADGTVEDFELTDVNPRGAAFMRQPREALLGMRTSAATPLRCNGTLFADYVRVMETGASIAAELRVSQRRFTTSWLWHQVVPVEGGLAVTLRDIAARKNEEEQLRRASVTDELTQLFNRRGFLTLADQQLRLARRQGRDLVLFFADLDKFKMVNDRFGHAAGDRTLMAVAKLLRSAVRESDIVARLGGDEFTILAVDGDSDAATAIPRRIMARVKQLNERGELPAPLSLSIGHVRVRATDTASLGELLSRADQQLYQRKTRPGCVPTSFIAPLVAPQAA